MKKKCSTAASLKYSWNMSFTDICIKKKYIALDYQESKIKIKILNVQNSKFWNISKMLTKITFKTFIMIFKELTQIIN